MTKKIFKTRIIRAAFESGRKLTALDAWKLCRSLCLAEIVRDLKKCGLNIAAEYKTENGCRFAVYHLLKSKKKGA